MRVDGQVISQSSGSWELGLSQGYIKFDSTFISTNDGLKVSIDWIPKAFHTMATYRTALDLIDSSQIIDGEEVRNPLAARLDRRLGSIADSIRPKGVIASTAYEHWTESDEDWIYQWEHFDS